jgi:hypothetical protein
VVTGKLYDQAILACTDTTVMCRGMYQSCLPQFKAGHEEFMKETGEIFHLVNDRINLEKNKLFPLFL